MLLDIILGLALLLFAMFVNMVASGGDKDENK